MTKRITFGYNNLCYLDSATFTPSSEATDWDADNLAKIDPAQFWRITTITGAPNIVIGLPQPYAWDMVALLYATASPHHNMMKDGLSYSAASWATTNCDVGFSGDLLHDIVPRQSFTASGAGAAHIAQTYTRHTGGSGTFTVAAKFLILTQGSPTAHLEFEIGGDDSNNVYAQVDRSDGSLNASGARGTGWSLVSTPTLTLVTTNVYELNMIVTVPAEGDIRLRVRMMTTGWSFTMVGSENASLGGAVIEKGSTPGGWIDSKTGRVPFWTVGGLDDTDLLTFGARNDESWFDHRGWLHTSYLYPQQQYGSSITLYMLDPNNDDSQLDISGVFLGKVFRPARNFIDWSITPLNITPVEVQAPGGQRFLGITPGPRSWRLSFSYMSAADAYAGFHEMAFHLQRHAPVFISIDEDDTSYVQETRIFGTLNSLQLGATRMMSGGPTWPVDMTVVELLK